MDDLRDLHACSLDYVSYGDEDMRKYKIYGDAITECYEDDKGRLWVDNGEYGSQVNYCPVCGFKARTLIDPTTLIDLSEA